MVWLSALRTIPPNIDINLSHYFYAKFILIYKKNDFLCQFLFNWCFIDISFELIDLNLIVNNVTTVRKLSDFIEIQMK